MSRIRRRRSRRGIFLISVLLTTMLIAMFIGAAIALSPSALGRTEKSGDLLSAHAAAASGIEYALARLQKDPNWTAQVAYSLTEPDLIVRENQGNVIGLVKSPDGKVGQFRIRFNLENGTPANDPDQLPNSTAPMTIDYSNVSYSNVLSSSDFTLPAVGGTPAMFVPQRSIYLAVEGRCGPACDVLTATDYNPALSSDFSHKSMRGVYKITNILPTVAVAAAMSAGKFTAVLPADETSDKVEVDSVSGVPALRTKQDLSVTGGNIKNLVGKTNGDLRVPTAATPVYNGLNKLTRKDEAPADAFYALKWADVRKADGTNTLTAGTYVWYDDGSLHYYDMAPADYVDYVSANPLDLGTTVYTQSGGQTALTSSINVTSTGTGASLKTEIIIHKDTSVTAATNTTELGVLPRKGAAESPTPGGTGTGTTTEFKTAIQAAFVPVGGGDYTATPAGVTWLNTFGPWADANGYGDWDSGDKEWDFGSVELEPGGGDSEISSTGWAKFQTVVNAYLESGGLPPVGVTFTAGTSPAGTAAGAVAASLVEPRNITVNVKPSGGASSAVLSSDDSMTFGTKVTGKGASLVSGVDIKLVGLGINLASTPNASDGVSIYAKRNVFMSALDTVANKFSDISLKGVVYAQGNVDIVLGGAGYTKDKWGKFHLTGVVVAYGGDPALTPDLLTTSGKINITATNQKLKFDGSYLSNLMLGGGIPPNAQYGGYWWVVE